MEILNDPSSFSNVLEFKTLHFHLDLFLDFKSKCLLGKIVLKILSLSDSLSEIHLDTLSLSINSVFLISNQSKTELSYKLSNPIEIGQDLSILLTEKKLKNSIFFIEINYQTISSSDRLSGLNWLEPSQTVGKQYPYFFTQAEPIYARSIAPLQDSPSIKSTYSAQIKVDYPFNVYMSAESVSINRDSNQTTFFFVQSLPIPSYLLAILSGNIVQHNINERIGIISEPEKIIEYSKELEDTEKFVSECEKYLFSYEWRNYNVVILPPSFPYGGMENPQLTFASPTIIAGDKSNISVVIHEIAHSWTGNLMTCSNWNSFWLNEGFTVFIERKIIQKIYGQVNYELECIIGDQQLRESIETYGKDHRFTQLNPCLKKFENPDDAFSHVPYEKGFQLLKNLEDIVGEKQMREFIRFFVKKYYAKNCSTNEFINDFKDFFKGKQAELFNFEPWINKPGDTPIKFDCKSKEYEDAKLWAKDFGENKEINEDYINSYKTADMKIKCTFLQNIYNDYDKISLDKLTKFNELTNINFEGNCEIAAIWFKICIKNNYKNSFEEVKKFLSNVGRMKFVRPLYKELKNLDLDLARKIFLERKELYHSITSNLIEKSLELK